MKVEDVFQIVGGELFYPHNKLLKKIKTDSREIKKGDIFVALKGKNHDGNQYIREASLKKAGLIICEKKQNVHTSMIVVENTYQALLDLASYYRDKFHPLFIAITGSIGKTTTKEILYHILKSKYTVLKSPKNYNNHIGIPLTLFELCEKDDVAIVELGMNHKGEIEKLSKLVKPDLAIITAIGTSHIGYLKGKRNIFKAKMEITKGMEDGIVLVNGDDSYLRKIKGNIYYDVIDCGKHSTYGLVPYHIQETFDSLSFYIQYQKREYQVRMPITGSHFISNILLAIEAALLLNVDMDTILSSLQTFQMEKQRMEVIPLPNYTIIDDVYNASYESLKALISFVSKQKITAYFILGDILELGSYSRKYHKKIAKILRKVKKEKVLLVGKETKVMRGKNFYHFSSNEDVISYLKKEDLNGKTIVLKGSRGMHLEQIVHYLKDTNLGF